MDHLIRFETNIKQVGAVSGLSSIEALTNEVSVYAASPAFVREKCGPIANSILDAVDSDYFDRCQSLGMLPNIDIRVHRLNKGEFPAVPGWHCDGSLRETYFGQPDHGRVNIRDTVICTVSTHKDGVSNTCFLDEALEIERPAPDGDEFCFWREVHKRVPDGIKTRQTKDGDILQIGANSLHRAMSAHNRGVRLFFRMSMWHNNYIGDCGAVANQQQVYILSEANGW